VTFKVHVAVSEEPLEEGDWVAIRTPTREVRAQAAFNDTLDPRVVCGEHGWWQAAPQIDEPGYDPLSREGANFNLLVRHDEVDPISGSPLRQGLCEVERVDPKIGIRE
jgi:anaerobic selenocysteine-containing dehydrogenase